MIQTFYPTNSLIALVAFEYLDRFAFDKTSYRQCGKGLHIRYGNENLSSRNKCYLINFQVTYLLIIPMDLKYGILSPKGHLELAKSALPRQESAEIILLHRKVMGVQSFNVGQNILSNSSIFTWTCTENCLSLYLIQLTALSILARYLR